VIKTQNKIRPSFDRWLLVISIVLGVSIIAIVVFSLIFLSNNLFQAFVPRVQTEPPTKFDMEGYRQVLKDLNRTPSVVSEE